ncbi:hypothetical protein [Winogradskyella sp.]|uniref:hypothetical protein n=1 Tax=Winogradskyella sp. TaxID=1883156 RepID=UPI003BAD21A6
MAEPLQDQIKHTLHFMSHNLQVPNYIIQHDSKNVHKEHRAIENIEEAHQHNILDFISDLIDSSSKKDDHQGEPMNEFFGSKKTIVTYKYKFKNKFTNDQKQDNFKSVIRLKKEEHTLQLYRPPQVLGII